MLRDCRFGLIPASGGKMFPSWPLNVISAVIMRDLYSLCVLMECLALGRGEKTSGQSASVVSRRQSEGSSRSCELGLWR